MPAFLLEFLRSAVRDAVAGALRSVALAVIAGALALFGVAGLLGALFLTLAEFWGPINSALALSGFSFVLAAAVSFPLWRPRRRRPPPQPQQPPLADLIASVARSAPSLTPKQMALGAVLAALALGLMAGGAQPKKDDG